MHYIYIYGVGGVWVQLLGSDEGGEDVDGKEGSELLRGWERVEITWPLVCR